jgi:adenylate cyclase
MFIITGLLALSLGAITFLVSQLISMDVQVTAESTNFAINAQAADAAERFLAYNRSETLMLLRTLDAVSSPAEGNKIVDYFFAGNSAAAALVTGGMNLINEDFFLTREADPEEVGCYLASRQDHLDRAAAGEILVLNGTAEFEVPMLVMLMENNGEAAALFLSSDTLAQSFGEGANISYLINSDGDLLVHPDQDLVQSGANFRDKPFVRYMNEHGDLQLQNLYTGEDGFRYFGSYTKLPQINLAVITNIAYDVVVETITTTTWRNILLSGGVLCLSILCVWFFSKTISNPLKKLSAAAGQIKEGDFNIELRSRSKDEIGLLTNSFVEMSRGLAERERLKDTFGRFINKEIAEQAMKGELQLGGETKKVTVFFSDIRDFTSISEKMDPHDVVEFLNSYMVRMVKCVSRTGGVVDKFIGDAIMAIWGAPVSSGNPAREALACVRTALMMRLSLQEYNTTRGTTKRPHIKMGCGINTGDVVAGQIGSSERMEYTVIGDTVNLASRTEALNKPFSTDILITENTWKLVKDYIIAEEMPGVTVKGKAEPVRMFAVVNMRATKRGAPQPRPVTLAELRSQLNLAAVDLKKVNTAAVEVKYKIDD